MHVDLDAPEHAICSEALAARDRHIRTLREKLGEALDRAEYGPDEVRATTERETVAAIVRCLEDLGAANSVDAIKAGLWKAYKPEPGAGT